VVLVARHYFSCSDCPARSVWCLVGAVMDAHDDARPPMAGVAAAVAAGVVAVPAEAGKVTRQGTAAGPEAQAAVTPAVAGRRAPRNPARTPPTGLGTPRRHRRLLSPSPQPARWTPCPASCGRG